jgi:hypothetical protein
MKALSRGCLSPSLVRGPKLATKKGYSAVRGFWPPEELAKLADGPTACGEVARGRCFFAWNLV